jgi:AcrR family transcriptional regulator
MFHRMPPPRLTPERIAEAALAIADREGLEAATLRRVATELGVHVTSLYNHVATRDEIIDRIVELMIVEARLPEGGVDWREWIRRFGAAMRQLARTHPGGFEAFQRRPVQGPAATAPFEAALAAFESAGFSPRDAYNAVKATTLAVLGLGAQEVAGVKRPAPGLRTELSVLPRAQFPRLHRVGRAVPRTDIWAFTLEVLIQGLSVRLTRNR